MSSIQYIRVSVIMNVADYALMPSILIANFEFAPAYPGQLAIPTAAITMSAFHLN